MSKVMIVEPESEPQVVAPKPLEGPTGFARLLAEWRERPGGHWAVSIHLAIWAGLALLPLLKMGYERVFNVTLNDWLSSTTGAGLFLGAFVLGWVLVELLIAALDLQRMIDVAARELALYYVSPIAYVLGVTFLLMIGGVFTLEFLQATASSGGFTAQPPSLDNVLSFMGTVFLFIMPLWTMRLLAEEQRQGTIELLLTMPVRDWEVVFGKYIAGTSLLMDTLAFTLFYPVVMFSLGNPERGPIFAGYIGIFLFAAALLAIGVFASSLTENQVIAAVVSFAIYLGLILASAARTFVTDATLKDVLGRLNLFQQLDGFLRGLVDSYALVYFLSVIAIALFLATRAVESRRWR